MEIKKKSLKLQNFMSEFRHDIHIHPELAFKEVRTTSKLVEAIECLGLKPVRLSPTGLYVDITGNNKDTGRMVVLRGDIDALSTTEIHGRTYRSVEEGLMHACGHDAHLSMLLGAVNILNEMRNEFAGTVRCLFQPAEEPSLGALRIIEQKAVEGADMFFGMHVMAKTETGTLGLVKGASLAAISKFTIKVKARASHGSQPNLGIDAGLIASEIYSNIQSIVSRRVDPMTPAVISIGMLRAGTAFNIIPGEAELVGSCRFFDQNLAEQIKCWIKEIAEGIALAYGAKAELEYVLLDPVLYNDELPSEIAIKAAHKVVDASNIIEPVRIMGSEDFAWYRNIAPTAFMWIGSGLEGGALHTEDYLCDDNILHTGASMYATFAIDALEILKNTKKEEI